MEKLKTLYARYKHGIPLVIYVIVYLTWFAYLEENVTNYQVIHMAIDDYIPFCEIFVIPYFLWFGYIAITVLFLFFKDKDSFYKSCIFLCTGMTIFLVISTLWPNGHHLRPAVMPRDNIFTQMIANLYQTDTATNLWPSIHTYNSLGAHFAIMNCKALEKKRGIRIGSLILAVSIILSTVLIKQHSVFDMLTAFVLAAVMYAVCYRYDLLVALRSIRNKKKAGAVAQ
ncbi:MAG: phosphatase PAP2 family protein [Lachnospiraceae bacterium]|nr:phosphatase PAP2 family protein [Lachnospiraceae bacterium]